MTSLELIITAPADRDLDDIWSFIADDDPVAATRWIERLTSAMRELAGAPKIGRPQERLGKDVQSFPVDRYVIYYRVGGRVLYVLRVLSGYQDIGNVW